MPSIPIYKGERRVKNGDYDPNPIEDDTQKKFIRTFAAIKRYKYLWVAIVRSSSVNPQCRVERCLARIGLSLA